MPDYQSQLIQCLSEQSETIARHLLSNGETVWVRKTGKSVPQWRYTLLGILSKTLHLSALRPVPNLGGKEALIVEARRLQELSAAGISVPRLLAKTGEAIMFSNVGQHNFMQEIEEKSSQITAFAEGLQAIATVHDANQYLSQAFVRNIIRQENGGIAFIDFEDDPAQYMPLIQCQCRDYLCYLQSAVIWLEKSSHMASAIKIWQAHFQSLPASLQRELRRNYRPALWLRRLSAEWLGNDTLRLAAMAKLLYQADQL